jgi:hypothetical protein
MYLCVYSSDMILHAFLYTTIMFTEVTSHKLRKINTISTACIMNFLCPMSSLCPLCISTKGKWIFAKIKVSPYFKRKNICNNNNCCNCFFRSYKNKNDVFQTLQFLSFYNVHLLEEFFFSRAQF